MIGDMLLGPSAILVHATVPCGMVADVCETEEKLYTTKLNIMNIKYVEISATVPSAQLRVQCKAEGPVIQSSSLPVFQSSSSPVF